jgi:hypothetical protein
MVFSDALLRLNYQSSQARPAAPSLMEWTGQSVRATIVERGSLLHNRIRDGDMIDVTTRRPLRVSTADDAPPYIMVALEQLAAVTAVLDAHEISYWVDEEAFSIDDEPEITPAAGQRLLDSIP